MFNEKKCGIEKDPRSVQEETRHVRIECLTNEVQVDEDQEETQQQTSEEPAGPILRRSARDQQPPDFYGVRVNLASEVPPERLQTCRCFV